MIPEEVKIWLADNHFGTVHSSTEVKGGCINRGVQIVATSGISFFLKVNPSSPPDMFLREFEGLSAICQDDRPRVPEPFLYDQEFMLMEFLTPAPRVENYWEDFGYKLANLHNHVGDKFGFLTDNFIGSTPQVNPLTDDGYDFFIESRLINISNLVRDQKLIDREIHQKILELTQKLHSLIPDQPPSLLHGDLWSGNVITDSNGAAAIIDPAVHYGWAESELAMTTLFGTFPRIFYEAYTVVRKLEPGFEDRFPIYNLYHILNHVLLFGGGYLGMLFDVINRFG